MMTVGYMLPVLFILSTSFFLFRAYRLSKRSLHILQLEGYRNGRYLNWLKSNWPSFFTLQHVAVFVVLTLVTFIQIKKGVFSEMWMGIVALAVWVVFEVYRTGYEAKIPVKKPLVMTMRAWRILGVTLVLSLSVSVCLFILSMTMLHREGWLHPTPWTCSILIHFSTLLSVPFLVIIANILLIPVEKSLQRMYREMGYRKLKTLHPLVIGITGSFGKTTTKNIVGAVVVAKYKTWITPHSFNTLMGITRTIREDLNGEHEVFVVEMGAYRRGDIAELCELVSPKIGILTAIGPMHLERFGSMEAIEQTKSELIFALPPDGCAVINVSDLRCRKVAETFKGCKVVKIGMKGDPADIYALSESIRIGEEGMSFDVVVRDEPSVRVTTKLVGKHNITNILCGIAVGLELGIDLHVIQKAIRRMEGLPHRLQLCPLGNGVTLIDDSFNSNPTGFQSALDVLSHFSNGRRFLITPGMVELGEKEAEENRKMGEIAAGICSYVILVENKRASFFKAGLLKAGFPEAQVKTAKNFAEANALVTSMTQAGDAVLIENDLPDNY